MKYFTAFWSALVISLGIFPPPAMAQHTYTLELNGCDPANRPYNDNSLFTIAGDELRTNAVLDAVATPTCTICIRTTDSGLATYDEEFVITVNDVLAPTVADVNSPTVDGLYSIGDTIDATVQFSEPVNVTGTPRLTLETGATDAAANYIGGTGTDTLTFRFTVASGHTSADLDYVNTASLALNGGTIRDGAGHNATLALPAPGAAGSLGANRAIVIDTTGPSVADVNSPAADGSYISGDIDVTVQFTEAVIVAGTPQLTLETGATDAVAGYTGGSGTDTLTFRFTIVAGYASSDLDYASATSLALNGGAITDTAGNDASLTLAEPGAIGSLGANRAIVIDTTGPAVADVNSPAADGSYTSGSLDVTVRFTETVNVAGTPQLTLETGATDAVADYIDGTGTDILTFRFTIAAGYASSDLDYASAASLALNGGTIRDTAGNDASLTLPVPGASGSLGANRAIVIDTTGPAVADVNSPAADGVYNAGDTIEITIQFTETVNVTGTPQLTLETGATDAATNYGGGSGTATLAFRYTAAAVHTSDDLDYASATSLALNGGTIRDTAGNDALLTLALPGAAGSLGANKSIVINAAPIAETDTYEMDEDTILNVSAPGVLDNDTDADDTLTVSIVNEPVNGVAELNGDGSFTYTPDRNYFGTDVFTYIATDGTANSDVTSVIINVAATDEIAPVITIIGDNPAYVEQNAEYSDAGATATDDKDGEMEVAVLSSNVDTRTVGEYQIIYSATDPEGNESTALRTVYVQDTESPVITVNGDNPVEVALNSEYADAGATATDNVDSEVAVASTDNVNTGTAGDYEVTYTATDSAGNTATATRTVTVQGDDEPPVITVTGDNPIRVRQYSVYQDEGATVTDNADDDIRVATEDNVDTSTVGEYKVTYTAEDSAGNKANAERTVEVYFHDDTPPIITLNGFNPISVFVGDTYVDAGATAEDNEDGPVEVAVISNNVDSSVAGTYTVVYEAADSYENRAQATRTVIVGERTVSGRIHGFESGGTIKINVFSRDLGINSYTELAGSKRSADSSVDYTVSELPPASDYIVEIRSGDYPYQVYDGKNSVEEATLVDLGGGSAENIDFTLPPPDAVISGRVVFPDGATEGDLATVQAHSASLGMGESARIKFRGENEVDYTIEGLFAATDYIVSIWPDSYASRYYDGSSRGVEDEGDAKYVDTDSAEANDIDFDLVSGGVIYGYVTGKDPAGARVEASDNDGTKGAEVLGDGAFEISGLRGSGPFTVAVWIPGSSPFYYNEETGAARDAQLASPVMLANGMANIQIDIPRDEMTILGAVMNEQGEPLGSVWVDARPDSQNIGNGTFTLDDGIFEISGLPADSGYTVTAKPEASTAYISDTRQTDGNEFVEIFLEKRKTVFTLNGGVKDENGIFIPNVIVEIRSDSTGFHGWDSGNLEDRDLHIYNPYEIEGILPADDYEITARPPANKPFGVFVQKDVEIFGDRIFDIVLTTGANIDGHVYDGDSGKPVEGARIFAVSETDGYEFRKETESNAKGYYKFENAPKYATYTITATADGHAAHIGTITGASEGRDIHLEKAVPITGTVTDEYGEPLGKITVVARSESLGGTTGYAAMTETDASGNYQVAGIKDTDSAGGVVDDYAVAVFSNERLADSELGLRPGDRADFALYPCGPGNEIFGTVFDFQSNPAPNALVDVFETGGAFVKSVVADGDGEFGVTCLPGDGEYHLRFSVDGTDLSQWAGTNNTGIDDPNPAEAEIPAGARAFEPGSTADFAFSRDAGPAVSRSKRIGEMKVGNLRATSNWVRSKSPKMTVLWEASESGMEEGYYFDFTYEQNNMNRRNAPDMFPISVYSAEKDLLETEADDAPYWFRVAPVYRGSIRSTEKLGFRIDTVSPSNASVSELAVSVLKKGTFVDSPVGGLTYETGGMSGKTDSYGAFMYRDGDAIAFSIAGIPIGEALADVFVTPIDLVEGAENETDTTVTNICRLLQTLDWDGNLDNNIKIHRKVEKTIGEMGLEYIDFTQSIEDFGNDGTVLELLNRLNENGGFKDGEIRSLRSAEDALEHLLKTLEEILPGERKRKSRRNAETVETKPGYVTLQLGVTGASEMYISSVDYGQGGEWEPYYPTREWKLPEGESPEYLYVRFRDRAGNTTNSLVHLSQQHYRISASTDGNGDIEPYGDVVVTQGDDREFTVTPDEGYIIGTVVVDGGEITLSEDNTVLFEDVGADHSISVTFEEIRQERAKEEDGGGGGICFISASE